MSEELFFSYYTLILIFGIWLSFSFAGISTSKKSVISFFALLAGSGLVQILIFVLFDEDIVWKLYPIITHLPIGIVLYTVFKKRVSTVMAAVSLAYLCCQPSKWFGLLIEAFTKSQIAEYIVRIIILVAVCIISIYLISPYVSRIYNKDTKSIFVFGGIPIVYYVYDYITAVYTDLWLYNSRATAEFLPFLLCVLVMLFYIVYYREYEKKTNAEHKENIVQTAMRQQGKELEAMRNSNTETRILRHDMRHLLNNVAMSIKQDDKETALALISGYISRIESASFHRYCENDMLNYIISNSENTCREYNIKFNVKVEIQELAIDTSLFASIVSNALDNAINAQKSLPEEKRQINLMIKTSEDKLLLSVKNPYKNLPMFIDGLPVNEDKGHGYGTQSIQYMTERLGGKCQFLIKDNMFVLRAII